MLGQDKTNTNTRSGGLGPRQAPPLDSQESENNFLNAIGFQGSANQGLSNSKTTTVGPSASLQQATPNTSANQSSRNPGNAQRGPRQLSASRLPLQRIATHPANVTAEYPSLQAVYGRGGGTAPQPSPTCDTLAKPNPWTRNNRLTPTYRPAMPTAAADTGAGTNNGTPGTMNRLSPDLAAYRAPRPNMSYTGSSYSLPSLGSGFNISDAGVEGEGSKSAKNHSSSDIRNEIGLKHSILQSGNTWSKYNWADVNGRDDDERFKTTPYLDSFVKAWSHAVPSNVLVDLEKDAYGKCDIDTTTGCFLQPITQPNAYFDDSKKNGDLEWHRQNWTANLLMHRRITTRYGNQGFGTNNNNNRRNYPPRRVQNDEPVILDESEYVVIQETEVFEPPAYHRFVPKVTCFLRPAEKFDMEAVRGIYNFEVQYGRQALDTQPLSLDEFEKIFDTAQQLGMPFVVAVRGSARNLGLTKGNLVTSRFDQVPLDDDGRKRRGEVLGFAFLSAWHPGFGTTGTSKGSAKLNVVVHSNYRRKKIGHSLVDRILISVSEHFSSEDGYDFVDLDDSPIYKYSRDREHQFYRLYFSFLTRYKHIATDKKMEARQKTYDDDLNWIRKMFEDGLNFTELVRFQAAHLSAKDWKGVSHWLDEVVFEYTCQVGHRMVKAD
ncbi:hypothetical protein C8A00DRAFT_31985 [Chaetomidium leptoderma]|uniref:Uncharacterized protein n=1 Tax=Chaetomidium leptoderma TaxID=669021 RepID=A0AAN6VP50_9PEZI|nr:hypothetical protein C8A00DRAFT_31985 [Chaetomidium leptoderma]